MPSHEPSNELQTPAWVGVVGRFVAIAITLGIVLLVALPAALGQGGPRKGSAGDSVRVIRSTGTGIEIDHAALERATLKLGSRFARIESQHFVVLSDADRLWTDQRLRLLEATEREVRRTMERMGVAYRAPEHKLLVILFDRRDDYKAFAREHDGVAADWVAGYYATRPNHVVFYHDRTRPDLEAASAQIEAWHREASELRREAIRVRARESGEAADAMVAHARTLETHATLERRRLESITQETSNAKAIHEAAHQLAFNCGLQSRRHEYPFWLTEGWATNFEADDSRTAFGPEHDHEPRLASWDEVRAAGRWMPLESFITLTRIDTEDADEVADLYAQAYALFRHLYRHERANLGAFFRDLSSQPAGGIAPERMAELFVKRFGDPSRIERALCR